MGRDHAGAELEEETAACGASSRPPADAPLPRSSRARPTTPSSPLDPDRRVTGWNKGAENLLGWSEAEALGMDGRLTFTPEDRELGEPEAEMARAAAEGRAGNERWHRRKDGGRFWGSGLLVPLRGGERGFLKVMRDRTARREGDERQGCCCASWRTGSRTRSRWSAPWPARAASAPRTWPGSSTTSRAGCGRSRRRTTS